MQQQGLELLPESMLSNRHTKSKYSIGGQVSRPRILMIFKWPTVLFPLLIGPEPEPEPEAKSELEAKPEAEAEPDPEPTLHSLATP